jgi:YegS/Rv2252/BmrU family lipid kinase
MTFHYYLLVNPAAGGGNGKRISEQLVSLMNKHNYLFTTYLTQYPNHELEIVADLATNSLRPFESKESNEPFPLLIVVGGDGTLHQVINQLKMMAIELPIAYIPAGSGNDFARGIGLSRDAEQDFQRIIQTTQPRKINILTYEEAIQEQMGISVNNVGIGLDAAIVHRTNHSTTKENLNKYNLGSLSYIASVLHVLFKQKGFPILVEANGQTYQYDKAFLCTTTNHPYFGGGVPLAPMAAIEKATLDFVVVERIPLYKIFWLIFLLFRKKHHLSKYYHHLSCTKLRIVSPTPQFSQADGEELGKGPYDISLTLTQQLFWA